MAEVSGLPVDVDLRGERDWVMDRIRVDDAEIEYEVRGDGEPVLLIPPSVVIDSLAHPLLRQPELAGGYRLIHYHRRGWAGSTLGEGPLASLGRPRMPWSCWSAWGPSERT
jgi:hypothetical protein